MRRAPRFPSLVLGLVLGVVRGAIAADAPPADAGRYDPATVETVRGKVTRISKVAFAHQPGYGVQMMVRTDKELLRIRLGPGAWVDRQKVVIEPQDEVTVTGSRVDLAGKPTLFAAEVRKGDEVLKLRDATGRPFWRPKPKK
jgi:hypothetical protein